MPFKEYHSKVHFAIYSLLIILEFTTAAKNLGVVRKGNSFGAINFDRVPGYALVNATYLTVENIKLISCISKCKDNKGCHSLNYRKKNNGGTSCELNELDRFSVDSELAFQKQTDSDHYEIKSPCRKMQCYNGGRCNANHMERIYQCRCPLQYTGDQCEKINIHSDKIAKSFGIVNGELFRVDGAFNHEMAKTVCESFGGDSATRQDIGRAASDAAVGFCGRAWTKEGNFGYPEYFGNCHSGSTYTGYFSNSCCPNKVETTASAWCLKKNIDYCKPGWYAHRNKCYWFRDDERMTWSEASNACIKKNAVLAKPAWAAEKKFINRVCSSCFSMHAGLEKVGDTWQYLDGSNVNSNMWASNEPYGNHNCAEWNTEADGLKAISCDALRGYMCQKTMLE